MVVKRKLEIPVFQEWRMKKLEPFVGIFTMVGILCLIQIMIGNRWNGAHIFFISLSALLIGGGLLKRPLRKCIWRFTETEAERITPQLRQTALRYMGDASLSEDIAQDVLLRLWQLLDELRTPMDGLALTMVRNECLMRLRKQPRTVGMEGHDMAEQPSVNPMAELTLSMLDKLPPLQQTILRLRHIDGMEIGEIATLLHKEEAAVRQNLSRGRKTLRLWIIKKMKEEEI